MNEMNGQKYVWRVVRIMSEPDEPSLSETIELAANYRTACKRVARDARFMAGEILDGNPELNEESGNYEIEVSPYLAYVLDCMYVHDDTEPDDDPEPLPITCTVCGGTGIVPVAVYVNDVHIEYPLLCPKCDGNGILLK